jgi:hypothetical protein
MKKLRGVLFLGRFPITAGVCAGLIMGAAILAIVKMTGSGLGELGFSRAQPVAPALVRARTEDTRQEDIARFADLNGKNASRDVRYIADWIADSRDAGSSAFVIVDKKDARIYVFDADARLRDSTPVLLGAAPGDDTVPGIGSRPIDEVLPAERTTAAGRFVGERGHNARGEDVVWVDYNAAVSMHRVLTTNPRERRLERLATPTSADNRVSYGCINVPVAFYETYLQPAFASQRAIVYVLPEFKSLEQVFGAYDVAGRARPKS